MNWKDKFPKENRYFETSRGILYHGDCLEVLKKFSNDVVDCVITSPPYWALRDYGIAGQLGLESTFDEYLVKLWRIFDEIYRILKPTGTCWVNLGDTYYGGGHGGKTLYNVNGKKVKSKKQGISSIFVPIRKWGNSYSKKCLCLIPERFVIGMIERKWILRNEIIWHKPNAMPSSVKDRFTVDFEKIFFFVKQKKYYFKQQLEPLQAPKVTHRKGHGNGQTCNSGRFGSNSSGRNKRTVWSISTRPFKGAHFATFPPKIPEICIKAGCPKCGVVLDPFIGSGTTAFVANQLSRRWIGIELNRDYCEIAKKRFVVLKD